MLWVHSRRGVNTLWVHSRRGLNFRVRGTAPQNRTDMKCTCHWGRPVHSWAVLLRRPKQAFPPPEAIIFMTNEDTEQSLVLKAAPLTNSRRTQCSSRGLFEFFCLFFLFKGGPQSLPFLHQRIGFSMVCGFPSVGTRNVSNGGKLNRLASPCSDCLDLQIDV